MFYVELLVDGEPYELELHPDMVFTKCANCGKKIYGYWHETECEACTPPPDPKKKLIEYLKEQRGVTFTEDEMDAIIEKGDSKLFLEEVYRRQKASHCRSSGKNHDL